MELPWSFALSLLLSSYINKTRNPERGPISLVDPLRLPKVSSTLSLDLGTSQSG